MGATPGISVAPRSSSSISFLVIVLSSDHTNPRILFVHRGMYQFEYHLSVIIVLHWSFGFRFTIVSIMAVGAGSSAVSALPILPTTISTSGICFINKSCFFKPAITSVKPAAGRNEGMYKKDPSSRAGINSRPIPGNLCLSAAQGLTLFRSNLT